MFKEGVVWGLATMSRSKDVTIASLCALALCNLTCEFWKEIANSNNCMQARRRALQTCERIHKGYNLTAHTNGKERPSGAGVC